MKSYLQREKVDTTGQWFAWTGNQMSTSNSAPRPGSPQPPLLTTNSVDHLSIVGTKSLTLTS